MQCQNCIPPIECKIQYQKHAFLVSRQVSNKYMHTTCCMLCVRTQHVITRIIISVNSNLLSSVHSLHSWVLPAMRPRAIL